MFIQTLDTPNPNAIKFMPGVEVSPDRIISFRSREDCSTSLLAKILFNIKNVEQVLFGKDFITVTKADSAKWEVLKPEVLLTMIEHFGAGLKVLNEEPRVAKEPHSSLSNDSDVVKQIKEIIEYQVRPAVAQDGGDIIFHSFENGVVLLELRGACAGCPSSTMTLKDGIENMLKHYVPEVESVEAVAMEDV